MAAAPSKSTQGRKITAVRIPDELHARLREAAEDRDLSINFLVVKAVEEFLDRLIPAAELRLTRDPEVRPQDHAA